MISVLLLKSASRAFVPTTGFLGAYFMVSDVAFDKSEAEIHVRVCDVCTVAYGTRLCLASLSLSLSLSLLVYPCFSLDQRERRSRSSTVVDPISKAA